MSAPVNMRTRPRVCRECPTTFRVPFVQSGRPRELCNVCRPKVKVRKQRELRAMKRRLVRIARAA